MPYHDFLLGLIVKITKVEVYPKLQMTLCSRLIYTIEFLNHSRILAGPLFYLKSPNHNAFVNFTSTSGQFVYRHEYLISLDLY